MRQFKLFQLGARPSQYINGTTTKLFSPHRVKCADQTQPMQVVLRFLNSVHFTNEAI